MKGIVFNILEEMVIEKCGMAAWNELLETALPDEDGAFTAGKSYPDENLFALVHAASAKLETPAEQIISGFGEYMFGELAKRYPIFIEQAPDLKTFLLSVDQVIHTEVRKLYDDPNLPSFEYTQLDSGALLMEYRSPRKLCILAEGLIRGAAHHYQTPITLSHPTCMHTGSDHCDLIVEFGDEQ